MSSAAGDYQQQLQRIEQLRQELAGADRRWNVIRTLLFLAAAALLMMGYLAVDSRPLVYLGWALVLAFLVAVTRHEQLRQRMFAERQRRSVLRRLVARNQRRWDRLPLWSPEPGSLPELVAQAAGPAAGGADPLALADDLDVFGRGSLFQLVSMASLGPGRRCLAGWLLAPARQQTASRRHAAVKRLQPLRDWRIDFYTQARRAASGTAGPDHFLRWIMSPSWLQRHRLLAAWSWLSPALLSLLLVGLLAAAVGAAGDATVADSAEAAVRWFGLAIGTVVGVNLLISTFLLGDVHDIFAAAISGRGDVDGYRRMFTLADALPEDGCELLTEVKRTLCDSQHGALVAITDLGKLAWAASLKHSGGWFLVYLLLQMGGLWDLHVLRRLERWQAAHAEDAAGWFAALGELEAAASLAALADENTTWASPQWTGPASGTSPRITARGLGHPLLADDVRVCNDVTVGPQGTLLLVTGSNMSGKSTLLRSIGLNVLLAGAGGPVCAAALSLPDLELATSIRVRDNLREGVSFYMAELQSLARVVRHAQRVHAASDAADGSRTTLLYLLDEILQGTNSRERQIAVAHVLRHLIDRGAIGAISTHDLELADDPALSRVAQTVHFRETITPGVDGREVMTFDYQMHQGVSPTTNALRLLEVVGLGNPET